MMIIFYPQKMSSSPGAELSLSLYLILYLVTKLLYIWHHMRHFPQANAQPRNRPHHMRQLYELSKAPTKVWKPLPGGDHNSSVLEEGYFESIADFITQVTGLEKREAREAREKS